MTVFRRASLCGFLFFSLLIEPGTIAQKPAKFVLAPKAEASDWPVYGGTLEAQHFSVLTQINKGNVAQLTPAWTFHTGALDKPSEMNAHAAFETNPVLWQRSLYLDSPFDEVFAVDAATGTKRWSFDPGIDRTKFRGLVTSRGVALWHAAQQGKKIKRATCADRVYVATLDGRLIALDALNGSVCQAFGKNGTVDLTQNVEITPSDDYGETSPVTVVGDVLVVGSSIGDNRAVTEELGSVRGFDAESGRLLWTWDPIPWARSQTPRTGAANVWSTISADAEHGLVYLPTGSPSPDFWGGFRKGNNQDANSLVALDVKTGKKVWAFQFVHHDLWDYDLAAEPALFTYHSPDGQETPAVVAALKSGMVFVFNRLTGAPIYPIKETAVPQTDVKGEWTSPTQPISSLPPLAPLTISENDLTQRTPEEHQFCKDQLAKTRYEGIFTPVTVNKDTLLYPGSIGGVNWGSVAIDPGAGILYANVNRLGYLIHLVPQPTIIDRAEGKIRRKLGMVPPEVPASQKKFAAPDTGGVETSLQAGAPYRISRVPFLSSAGFPCTSEPWGLSVAMNVNTGRILWQRPLGTMEPGKETGSITLGGPILTKSGLLITAATVDAMIRAFDTESGQLLWKADLPAPAQATPMTYMLDGKQYLVVAAGGHGSVGTRQSDAVVAFALPKAGGHGKK